MITENLESVVNAITALEDVPQDKKDALIMAAQQIYAPAETKVKPDAAFETRIGELEKSVKGISEKLEKTLEETFNKVLGEKIGELKKDLLVKVPPQEGTTTPTLENLDVNKLAEVLSAKLQTVSLKECIEVSA